MQNFTRKYSRPALAIMLALGLAACGESTPPAATETVENAPAVTAAQEAPRFEDGTIRFDRMPGELGYWANPSKHSLIETGVDVPMNDKGLLANIDDAAKVAPFMDWSLGLYKYRQQNGLKDDPVNVCISPAGPRHLQIEGGFRIIQDRNFNRV
jgi:hypothetical protein